VDEKRMEFLRTKEIVPPNPDCMTCHGGHVNVMRNCYDACPDCWPEGAKIQEPVEKHVPDTEFNPVKNDDVDAAGQETEPAVDADISPEPEDENP